MKKFTNQFVHAQSGEVRVRWLWISMYNICYHRHSSEICQWRNDRVMSWL